MTFTSPLMLLGLLALPALAAIYWLRNRSRPVVVSSLLLWTDRRRPKQGGLILQKLKTPLSFFLELLAIAMLALAAAGPAILKREIVRPLVVVLDDSYSMLAHDGRNSEETARDRAAAALNAELSSHSYSARFVFAGIEPRLLGESIQTPEEAAAPLKQWTCERRWADLPKAVGLAVEVGGRAARILVLSDHAPMVPVDSGQIQWLAFGRTVPNMAFTAATRIPFGDKERVLLEIANLSDSPGETRLTLDAGTVSAAQPTIVALPAKASKQIILTLPEGSPTLHATIADDSLDIDNAVSLLASPEKPIRVFIDIADADLRRLVVRALDASGHAVMVSDRPELIIVDSAGQLDSNAWRLEIVRGDTPLTYAGPFVMDHNHPLTEGMSLQSAIWSAGRKPAATGLPVITTGNIAMLSDEQDVFGRHRLHMQFVPKTSNLQDMPDWPILFANLLRWRRTQLPGATSKNVRLGQTVSVVMSGDSDEVTLLSPGNPPQKVKPHGRHVDIVADRIGKYVVRSADEEYLFCCNAISRDESDLTGNRSGQWGNWNRSSVYEDRRTNIGWIFLLVAVAAIAAHAAIIFHATKKADA